MVFGEPIYNTKQRRAALAEFKRYIDDLRRKKIFHRGKLLLKVKQKEKKIRRIRRNNFAIKLHKRRKRRRKIYRRGRRQGPITHTMFAAILEDLKRKEKQRKRFLRSLKKKEEEEKEISFVIL